jgi:adenylate kinase
MDGYPRSAVQANVFDALLDGHHLCLTAVVLLTVEDEEIVRRVAGRWVCPRCQTPYHVESNPPQRDNVCDIDGVTLEQRPDDRAETVRARLEVYRRNTAGLARHYRDKGLLREVFAAGDIEEVYRRIMGVLQSQAGSSC